MNVTKVNRLALEKSPYLLQHQYNHVDWFPWGEEALTKAKAEDKPIFLSIGYSTCYWCHVMERDSFETIEVAKRLNKDFISIKIDREELPEIDKLYMDAVVAMTGHGGWPMSVFLSPNLKPFFGGTFFWKAQFLELLTAVANAWENERDKINVSCEAIAQYLEAKTAQVQTDCSELKYDLLLKAKDELLRRFDRINGGFGSAPKFPPTAQLRLLLEVSATSKDTSSNTALELTLNKMARGGLCDQLGGGFHRYSTDSEWLVPHFEKMLYDNALLAITYFEAYRLLKSEDFLGVGLHTLDYILSEMTSNDGGFFCAQDAGAVGREGEFYVWDYDQIASSLNDDEFECICSYFSLSPNGNFENGQNILTLRDEAKLSDTCSPLFQSAKRKLLAIRNERTKPHLDDKVITSWNGLTIKALALGYQLVGDDRYLSAARNAAIFIKEKLIDSSNNLLRRYREGESRFSACLDDYAYYIEGLIELYQCDFDEEMLLLAYQLQKKQIEILWDKKSGGFFFSNPANPFLLAPRKEYFDESTPSANAISAMNLLKLAKYFHNSEFASYAKDLLTAATTELVLAPSSMTSMLLALAHYTNLGYEIIIAAKDNDEGCAQCIKKLRQDFFSNLLLAVVPPKTKSEIPALFARDIIDNKTTYYLCSNSTCLPGTTNPNELIGNLR